METPGANLAAVYGEERARLRATGGEIDRRIAVLEATPRYYGDDMVQQILDTYHQQQLYRLKQARPDPYFGRLDFQTGREAVPKRLYIGKSGVQDEAGEELVIDWRAPVASLFYSFTGQDETASYEAPEGTVEGTVHLKRNLVIRSETLQRVVDSYTRGADNLGVADEFLLYRLGENKDRRLRDIVSTIQAEQDRIIRADRRQALIIQGAAGSGKTTVALHRLAFLLYQYRDQMRADRMVVFAPSRLFLDYIADVLPELGVADMRQTTFVEFALDILGEGIELADRTRRLADWFEGGGDVWEEETHPARAKGSLVFKRYLEEGMDRYEASFVPIEPFTAWEGASLDPETVREWFYVEHRHYPLAKRRERVLARVKRWIGTEHVKIRSHDERGVLKKQALQRWRAYAKRWPAHGVLALYGELTAGHVVRDSVGKAVRSRKVALEDLAPLLFLHGRLYGVESRLHFDHAVVDEAQDWSPFQFAVLRSYCPSDSLTILGDMVQNIYHFEGIRTWDECGQVFDSGAPEYFELERSYRSTMEIIQFANEVAAPVRSSLPAAVPVFRSGEPVRVKSVPAAARIAALEATVRDFLQNGAQTVAVIGRTEWACLELYAALETAGLAPRLITTRQTEYRGGLTVAPVYLVKGLEFDAVLLMDVDENHYRECELDRKLLYVGCTRALHRLALLCGERPSPVVAGMAGAAGA